MLAATVGKNIENKIKKLFKKGDFTKATILDAIASIAVEEVANELTKLIAQKSKKKGLPHLTMRYSPGYGDLKLDLQPRIIELLDGNKLGIKVTESKMLLPEKSITAIIGLSNKSNSYQTKCNFNCASCKLNTCVYNRKEQLVDE